VIDVLAVSWASFTAVNRAVYRELAQRGWSVELVIPARTRFGDAPQPATPDDPPLHLLEPLRGGNARIGSFAGLLRLLEARRPRLVLLDNDPNSRMAAEVGAWARLRGAKLVCQSCENMTRRLGPSVQRAGLRGAVGAGLVWGLGALARPNVGHVFVISDDGEAVLREQRFRRVTKIPLGFDPALFRPDPELRAATRERLGLTEVTVAYFGRVVESKGVHLLVEALAGLKDRPFHLLLDEFARYRDPYAERLTRLLAERGLEDRVVRFDASHTEMPAYMNAADVVALPSISTATWKEQYGRVAPEAMACGCAVVAANSGALPELVGDGGVIVPEGDVPALRRALADLMADPKRRRALGALATARAHAELDLTRQADVMERVFRDLLAA